MIEALARLGDALRLLGVTAEDLKSAVVDFNADLLRFPNGRVITRKEIVDVEHHATIPEGRKIRI